MPKKNQQNQSKSENTLEFAKNIVNELSKVKRDDGIMDRFRMSVRYLMGQHKIKDRSPSKGNDVWNKYAEIVENRINHAVAQIPRWRFKPTADQSIVTSDMLNHFLRDVLWEKDEWDEKAEECLHGGAHAGSDWIFCDVDDEGWMTTEHVPMGAMLWDKQKRYKDLRVIGRAIKKSVQEIKEEHSIDVIPETILKDDQKDAGESYEVTSSNPYAGPIVKGAFGESTDIATSLLGEAYIFELWMEDKSKETIPFKKEEIDLEHAEIINSRAIRYEDVGRFNKYPTGVLHDWQNHVEHLIAHNEFLEGMDKDDPRRELLEAHIDEHNRIPKYNRMVKLDVKRPKFPYGRRIAYVQNNLLHDKPNTMPIHWRDRWVKWDWNIIPDQLMGKTLGHDLIDPQNALNHRKNSITQNINLLLNGIRKVAPGAYKHLKETGKLNNLIGLVVETRNPDDFTVDFGKELPASFFQDLFHGENFMNNSGANEDAAAGRNPAAGTPNAAIENLIQQFNIRTGSGVRHFALALEKCARNAAVIMREYLPDDTAIKMTDGQEINEKQWREIKEYIDPNYIIIDMESYNATTRQQRLSEAIEFFREGVFPLRKHVLMYLDNPDKYQIIKEGDELDALREELKTAYEEIESQDKEINTMKNRLQSSKGEGNAAA